MQTPNALEEALMLAASEPAHRPAFYNLLLASEVYVLGSAGEGEGKTTLNEGSQISIQHWQKQDGTTAIPFFTSLEALQASLEQPESYLALSAKSLFEMTLGSTLVMNPKSDYGKEFYANEIQQLLDTGMNNQKPMERTVQEPTQVLLGQPAEPPTKLLESLKLLFAKHNNVQRAFIAMMHDPSQNEKPNLIIGLEATGDVQKVMREAGSVVADVGPTGEPVDMYHIKEKDSGLGSYFLNESTPFYVQKKSGGLLGLFGLGKK